MATEHLHAVLDRSRKGGSHLVLLLVIASYSDPRGQWIADQPTLQRRAHLSRRRVQKLLGDLVQSGELAVTPGNGRGNRSTYRLLLGQQNGEHPGAPAAQKSGAESTLLPPKEAAQSALSHPPSPPFPPNPQSPLNPPKNLKHETFGLAPAARGAGGEGGLPGRAELVSPLPFGEGGSGTHGRGAGGEGLPGRAATRAEGAFPVSPRLLSAPQSAVHRANLLLEAAAVPLPSPAQIGLWTKTLGGIEPFLDLLRGLIDAGLANKRQPIAYLHRVVIERAARPEPARAWSQLAPAWLPPRRGHNPLLLAGADDRRREQARLIAEKRGGW